MHFDEDDSSLLSALNMQLHLLANKALALALEAKDKDPQEMAVLIESALCDAWNAGYRASNKLDDAIGVNLDNYPTIGKAGN